MPPYRMQARIRDHDAPLSETSDRTLCRPGGELNLLPMKRGRAGIPVPPGPNLGTRRNRAQGTFKPRRDSAGAVGKFLLRIYSAALRAFRTSSVCSPRRGAARRTDPGVAESLTGTPIVWNLPVTGWLVSTTMSRARICGSV